MTLTCLSSLLRVLLGKGGSPSRALSSSFSTSPSHLILSEIAITILVFYHHFHLTSLSSIRRSSQFFIFTPPTAGPLVQVTCFRFPISRHFFPAVVRSNMDLYFDLIYCCYRQRRMRVTNITLSDDFILLLRKY